MARQRRTFDDQIVDLVTQGRAGRGQIFSTPAMAAVGPNMIEENAILNEHLSAGAVALDKLDQTVQDTLKALTDNDVVLDDASKRLAAAEGRINGLFDEVKVIPAQITAAQQAAQDAATAAAAADAKAKVEAAEARVATTAAADAKAKADAAQAAALAAAKTYADAQASGASGSALEAAKLDATAKADAAKQAAITAAALDATAKKEQAEANAAADAKAKADKALADAKADATAKANAAEANAAANTVLKMNEVANSKNATFYGTAAPTSTSPKGTLAGDTYRRRNAAGNIIGEWEWSGSAWTQRKMTSESMTAVDVGVLTAGTAVISDAVALKIAAGTAAIQQADIGNLTVTGSTNLADAVARRIAANTGTFIEARIGNLVADTGTMSTGVINKLYSEVVESRYMKVSQLEVGGNSNLAAVADTVDMWDASTFSSGVIIASYSSSTQGRAIRFQGGAGIQSAYGKRFPVVPGDHIQVQGTFRNDGGNAEIGELTLGLQYLTATGATHAWDIYATSTKNTHTHATRETLTGTSVVPDGAAYARPLTSTRAPSGTPNPAKYAYMIDPIIRYAASPSLLVKGGIKAEHIESNSITVDKLRVSGSNSIPDPAFLDAALNAERLAGTTAGTTTMSFAADDVSAANVLVFTEHSTTQRSLRVGGMSDHIPVTLGDRVKMSVQYRCRGASTSGNSNIRFALYHDSATKSYIRYVGVGSYQTINTGGDTWYTWEADYVVTDADTKFIRPMIQFRNNGFAGNMELKAPRLEVASKLSITAPVDTIGTTLEAQLGIPLGQTMPALSFIRSSQTGTPTGYRPAMVSSSAGADLRLDSGHPGGSQPAWQATSISLGVQGISMDAGAGVGKLDLVAGSATLNGEELMAGAPSFRQRLTLNNSFGHHTGSGWNGVWIEQLGKLTSIFGAYDRGTAWGGGQVIASLPTRFRPVAMVGGNNFSVSPAGNLMTAAGSGAGSGSIMYFAL